MTLAFRPPLLRSDALRNALPAAMDLIARGRAGEIADGYVEDYLALHWLKWNDGELRLTTTGSNVCKRQIERNDILPPRPVRPSRSRWNH